MSSSLVRQALEFVDPEESVSKRGKRPAGAGGGPRSGVTGQEHRSLFKKKNKKSKKQEKSKEVLAEENIRKLLALSKPVANSSITSKIVERAIKGKPLIEKPEVKQDEGKSILFPDEKEESFKKFEKKLFCK